MAKLAMYVIKEDIVFENAHKIKPWKSRTINTANKNFMQIVALIVILSLRINSAIIAKLLGTTILMVCTETKLKAKSQII